MISNPIRPSATLSESRQPRSQTLAIKTEKVLVHHEAHSSALLLWRRVVRVPARPLILGVVLNVLGTQTEVMASSSQVAVKGDRLDIRVE